MLYHQLYYWLIVLHYQLVVLHYQLVVLHYQLIVLHYQSVVLHYWLIVLHYQSVVLHYWYIVCLVLCSTHISPLQRPQLVVSRSNRVILMYVPTTALTHSLTHLVTCLPPQTLLFIHPSPPPQEEVKDNWDDVSGDEEAESVSDLV